MHKCNDCKWLKLYKTTTGGECTNENVTRSDIEYPNSWCCNKWVKKARRGRPPKKASFIEKLIKFITGGKY